MSDQIRSALSPKFGDEWDRIFGGKKCKYGDPTCPCQDGDMCHYEGPNPMKPPKLFAEGAIVQCETCYEDFSECVHTSPHREHGGPCERHGCKPTVPSDVARPALDNPPPKA